MQTAIIQNFQAVIGDLGVSRIATAQVVAVEVGREVRLGLPA